MADVQPGMSVLEPSAGEGALARPIQARSALVWCIEIDDKRAAKLPAAFVGDFLQVEPHQAYDRVVMNPPFAKRADIHHVTHARKFLKPDGKLVAIMSAGVAFREDALAREFREQCETIEPLPDGAFKESGTGVRTVVVTMKAAA
jgi:16S rRNA A1518/A1519 N6-dimethyltransferase RsmA/KsgA/DIM1 with predicted DNA glycosylase/AP lyase activity